MNSPFEGKYIAVVGVSHDPEKYGYRIFRDMVQAGWHVDGVNPKKGTVEGKNLVASLDELPQLPDIVVTVVPPTITSSVVEKCIALNVPHIWMQPGSESTEAIEKAKAAGIIVSYNQCIMIRSGLW